MDMLMGADHAVCESVCAEFDLTELSWGEKARDDIYDNS